MTRQPSDSRHVPLLRRLHAFGHGSHWPVHVPCSMMVLTMATELAEAGSSRTKL